MASTQRVESMHLLNTKMISGLHIGIYSKTLIFILLFLSLFSLSLTKIFASPYINEFMAHPSSGSDEWVEFYNTGGTDLSTYYLDDDLDFNSDSGSTAKKSLATMSNPTQNLSYFTFSSFLNNS